MKPVQPPDAFDVDGLAAPVSAEVGSDSDSSLLQPRFIGIGAAAVVVIAGALFWMFSGSDDATQPGTENIAQQATVTESDFVIDEVSTDDTSVDVDALLSEARAAREAGQIFNPPGSNALELFAAALRGNPTDNISAAELDATVGRRTVNGRNRYARRPGR